MGQKRRCDGSVKTVIKRARRCSNTKGNGSGITRHSTSISTDTSGETFKKRLQETSSNSKSCKFESCISDSNSDVGEARESCGATKEVTKYLALDCEMVGVGEQRSSALARCSVVNYHGEVIFDSFVKPDKPVTDYRTKWSGVREADLKGAMSFKKARKTIKKIIGSNILIGHSMQCDLYALNLFHPMHLLRDTARYYPIRLLAGLSMNNTPSLKDLSSILLNKTIQDSEHCSVEDARAALSLYKLCKEQWEKELSGELATQSYFSDLYWPVWTRTENFY